MERKENFSTGSKKAGVAAPAFFMPTFFDFSRSRGYPGSEKGLQDSSKTRKEKKKGKFPPQGSPPFAEESSLTEDDIFYHTKRTGFPVLFCCSQRGSSVIRFSTTSSLYASDVCVAPEPIWFASDAASLRSLSALSAISADTETASSCART